MITETKLTRQRFFELRILADDFNHDRIDMQQFILQLTPPEVRAYGTMFRKAEHNLERVEFEEVQAE